MTNLDEKAAIHPIFKSYITIAEGIAKTIGSHCEVVLHDLTDISSSIVAIYNGHVTGREIGAPMTDLGLAVLRCGKEEKYLLNYPNKTIKGKKIKSTSIIIRDDEGNIMGSLCINLDVTLLAMTGTIINEMVNVQEDNEEETFPQSVNDLEKRIIDRAQEKVGKPVALLEKNERIEFIRLLDEMGLFLIKGSINNVADLLNLSKFTIYSYLDKKS